jgi:hypothetical protein
MHLAILAAVGLGILALLYARSRGKSIRPQEFFNYAGLSPRANILGAVAILAAFSLIYLLVYYWAHHFQNK